jgi:membrane fusion protein, heavy metal efflux system
VSHQRIREPSAVVLVTLVMAAASAGPLACRRSAPPTAAPPSIERGTLRGSHTPRDASRPASWAAPHATVQNPVKEADLTTITLTEQAEKRLGISTVPMARRSVPRSRAVGGEVIVPPGQTLTVSAPVAGTVLAALPPAGTAIKRGQAVLRLYPLPASADLTSAAVRLDTARKRAQRAEQLLKDEAGSQRSVEEAQAELALAEAQSAAVRPRLASGAGRGALAVTSPQSGVLQNVFVGPGQSVAAGAPLFQVDAVSVLWVRVPIYVGDLGGVQVGQPVEVQPLGADAAAGLRTAEPVAAPPTANAEAASTDLIFKLDNAAGGFRAGQRVRVSLPLTGSEEGLVVPWSAVVHDIHGGTWVYARTAPRTYSRRRVEVRHVLGAGEGLALLGRGPEVGAEVVAVGAAELYGTEFGPGK